MCKNTKVTKCGCKYVVEKTKECDVVDFLYSYLPDIKKIISNIPATIVILKDGRKGVAKVGHGDEWDLEKGVLYAYLKATKQNTRINAVGRSGFSLLNANI